jgi:acyl homoserine lactone synthase
MLRDAVAGKLIGIPADIIPEAEALKNVWEVTRTVISDEVSTQLDRSTCLSLMLDGAVDVAKQQGATELVSLSPVAMARTLRKLGYDAQTTGVPYRNQEDGRRYACISMSTTRINSTDSPAVPAKIEIRVPPVTNVTHVLQPQLVHSPAVI